MPGKPNPRVFELLQEQESAARDAYDAVRNADPHFWGGAARHRFTMLNARLTWLKAKTAVAQALVEAGE